MALDEHEFDRTYDKIKVLGQGNYGKSFADIAVRLHAHASDAFGHDP